LRITVGINGPDSPNGSDWHAVLERDGEGTEALATGAIEPHGRLRVGVPSAAFAGLVCLDPGSVENVHVWGDSGVQ